MSTNTDIYSPMAESKLSIDWIMAQNWAMKLAIVAGIVLVTWVLAKAAKWAFARLIDRVPLLQRQSGTGESVGASMGKIVSLIIWLLGMIAVLQQLNLTNVIKPLETLLNNIMGYVPNIVGAGIILFVGLVVARIVRELIQTVLGTLNLDAWAARGGLEKVTGSTGISKTLATLAYVLIAIVVSIAAVQTLQISAISVPASQVLNTVFNAIPLIVGAALLLGIAYAIGRWVSDFIEEVLPELGFDRAVHSLGLLPKSTSPSKIASTVSMTAIMLFFAIAAARMLNFPEMTNILNAVLETGGRVLFGSVIIAVGFLISNLFAGLVQSATEGTTMGANVVRYATIGLFVFIGLGQMGIGGPIVEIAFAAIAVAVSLAGALAFGLGGRDAAARALAEMQDRKATETPKRTAKK
jgi:hypothetical protein